MNIKEFKEKCKELESLGWELVETFPFMKKAVYRRENIQIKVGK